MKQLSLAVLMYCDDNNGVLPWASALPIVNGNTDWEGPFLGWETATWPYTKSNNVYLCPDDLQQSNKGSVPYNDLDHTFWTGGICSYGANLEVFLEQGWTPWGVATEPLSAIFKPDQLVMLSDSVGSSGSPGDLVQPDCNIPSNITPAQWATGDVRKCYYSCTDYPPDTSCSPCMAAIVVDNFGEPNGGLAGGCPDRHSGGDNIAFFDGHVHWEPDQTVWAYGGNSNYDLTPPYWYLSANNDNPVEGGGG
jgi:prepilin-type processing-associated H-X9-DG protein